MTEMAVVVQRAYDWNLWILPKVEKFPKSYRFSIGQNLISTSLDLLMNLVDATYQSKNSGALAAALVAFEAKAGPAHDAAIILRRRAGWERLDPRERGMQAPCRLVLPDEVQGDGSVMGGGAVLEEVDALPRA